VRQKGLLVASLQLVQALAQALAQFAQQGLPRGPQLAL